MAGDFRVFEESISAVRGERTLTTQQKDKLIHLVREFGNREIDMTLEQLADHLDVSISWMKTASLKWRRCFFFDRLSNGRYAIPEFFWWVPEPGINERTAMNRYVKRAVKALRANTRRKMSGDPNWKQPMEGRENVEEVEAIFSYEDY